MNSFLRALDEPANDWGPGGAEVCEESGHATSLSPDSPYIDVAVEVFSMLADMTRVKIILALRDGELPVGELAVRVGKTPTDRRAHV